MSINKKAPVRRLFVLDYFKKAMDGETFSSQIFP